MCLMSQDYARSLLKLVFIDNTGPPCCDLGRNKIMYTNKACVFKNEGLVVLENTRENSI